MRRSCVRRSLCAAEAFLIVLCAGCAGGATAKRDVQPAVCAPGASAVQASWRVAEVELRFMSGGDELVGTLSVPQGSDSPRPAVLLLQDAGPMDRDGTQQGELGYRWAAPVKPQRDLARALAERGYVVLRYDKRTCVEGVWACRYPRSWATDEAVARLEQDAQAAWEALRARPEVAPAQMGIVGHGEGAELALGLRRSGAAVKAMALLAPSPYPIEALIQHQHRVSVQRLEQELARGEEGTQGDLWRRHLEALRAAQREEERLAALKRGEAQEEVFGVHAAAWQASWRRHERAMQELGRGGAIVAVFGDRDEVLPMEAARGFSQSAGPGVSVRVLTGITHAMIEAERGVGLGAEVSAIVVDTMERHLLDSKNAK